MKTTTQVVAVAVLALSCLAGHAQTYYLQSQPSAPFPYDPYGGAEPITTLDATRQIYQVQDSTNDWNMLMAARELDTLSTTSMMDDVSIDPGGTNIVTGGTNSGGGTYTNNFQPLVFGPDDLWIEITNLDIVNQQALLRLHGTVQDEHYQLLSSNVLSSDGEAWTLGEYITGAANTNLTDFSTFNISTNSQMFFRAHHADPVLAVQAFQDAIEPNPGTGDPGQVGEIQIQSYYQLSNDLPVYYSISGTAQSGVDYSNLTGVITIPASTGITNIDIAPLYDSQVDGAETLTLAIRQTNSYLIDPSQSSATISILDSSTTIRIYANSAEAVKSNGPPGIPAQAGQFGLNRGDSRGSYPQMTAYYAVSGTASNGEDYALLSGSIVFPDGVDTVYLDLNPISDPDIDGIKSVTVTLIPTNSYLVDPIQGAASLNVADSSTTLQVYSFGGDIIKPDGPPSEPAQAAQFQFARQDSRNVYPAMNAYYIVSGTASNGEDYTLLSGTIAIPDGATYAYLDVNPLSDTDFDSIESVMVTLVPTNSYIVDTNNSSATHNIYDSTTTVGIGWVQDAIETNSSTHIGQTGIFVVFRDDSRHDYPQMTLNYQVSGTASNGVDYQTLSGTVTLASGSTFTNIYVQTLQDFLLEGDETVKLTIIPSGNAYFTYSAYSNATVTIHDTFFGFVTVSNLNAPIGLDYYGPSNSLIVSYNENVNGRPFNFAQMYTNIVVSNSIPTTNVAVTNWSGISNLAEEVYFTMARMPANALTNSAGFTNGDLFFGSGSGIGWLSADSTRSNLDWCILTNSTVTNALLLRGGICMDQTGTFSNHIIAVASPSADSLGLKGVWRVDAHAQPTLIAQINTEHLEGVTTLTNDVQKWGPWAGKIITGDESHRDPVTHALDPLIYTIDTNGVVATNETLALISGGIYPEDFQIVPPNQALYITAFNANSVMEVPSTWLTNYVGDLMITDAGEVGNAALYMVHWDAQGSNFVTLRIPAPSTVGGHIEHTTFAPIEFPGH